MFAAWYLFRILSAHGCTCLCVPVHSCIYWYQLFLFRKNKDILVFEKMNTNKNEIRQNRKHQDGLHGIRIIIMKLFHNCMCVYVCVHICKFLIWINVSIYVCVYVYTESHIQINTYIFTGLGCKIYFFLWIKVKKNL